jgi:hypothetical protein
MAYSKYLILFLTSFLFIFASCTLGGDGGGGGGGDTTPPVITSFIGPEGAVNDPTINITLEGSDDKGISGWMISFNNTKPAKDDLGWVANNPTTFSLGAPGVYTLYAWAKDAAGNVSDENANSHIDVHAPFNCKKWTILIHFAIDNNIDTYFEEEYGIVTNYLNTLENIKAADVAKKINILVLMDCYNSAGHFHDGYYCLSGGAFKDDLVVSKSEINSGSLNDIRDFMDWVVANYPAEKYLYSVFNHGSGFDDIAKDGDYAAPRGIAFDDSSSDCLSHYELGQAAAYLKNNKIGGNIELFYAFACLMGGVELAYEVKDSANYLLFSEETFPADYWSYEALQSINDNPNISGGDVGKAFCDSAESYFTNPAHLRDFTLSVIDLSKVVDLAQAIDVYAGLAIADINNNGNASSYNTATDNSLTFTASETNYYYADLGDYLNKISAMPLIGADVKNQVISVNQALTNCVIYKKHRNFALASGMTIYHNIWGSLWYYTTNLYRSLFAFGADNDWTDYLVLINSKNNSTIKPDAYEPDNSQSQARSLSVNGSKQRHTIHNSGDFDLMKVVLQSGTNYKIETYPVSGQTQCNTWLAILDTNFNVLLFNDNDGTGLYSRITCTCNVSGTYYIYVDSWGDLGVYDIDIRNSGFNLSNTENMDMDSINKNGNTEKQLQDLKNRLEQLKE